MLAETAALRLGTTVANAAAGMWLGGKRREQERHLSLDELVRLRVPGIRLQREVRGQFEQIVNAVFDRLEPHLEREFRGLEESGRAAVTDAVCDTFAAADLSDEALLAADAHPAELTRAIVSSVRPPLGLGEAETRLYERLLSECSEYYVQIVRGLPAFKDRAEAELLSRTSSLGAEIALLLKRLPDRSLFAPEGTDRDEAFRRRYLQLVSDTLDEVTLFRGASDQPASLSVAYVSLRATWDDGTPRRRASRTVPTLRSAMSDWEDGGQSPGMRAEAALGEFSRVLLRGEAGSGKTTLLRWLAVTAARGAFSGHLSHWNGLTPVLVKLREYSGRPLPRPEAMLDSVAPELTGVLPRAWVERQLESGRALLLIDGVDELRAAERRSVRDWLRRLLASYPDVRVVVTSRPTAAGADWLRRERFVPLLLDRMSPPDLAAFVRQWHHAARAVGDALPCPVEELPAYEQALLSSLHNRPHLHSLATTPLLAAMLCAMHLNQGRQLPRNRMELYRTALETLVHDRDAARQVPSAADIPLGLGDKLLILRDLAWWLSDNNRTEIALDRARAQVGRKLSAMRHLNDHDAGQVLESLRDRSGVLRSPTTDRLDFVHRTFQEYLAAKEATEQDRIGSLVERAHLDGWRETIVMAAGHANAPQREELLGGILDRAAAEPRQGRGLRLLAASCQETLPEVSPALAVRLDEAVERLLPPRRPTDPPALAAVGPSLLRRLPRSLGELTEKAAAQTVRTAALLGGEEALGLLASYAADRRVEVVDALVEGWAYFDAAAYAGTVLSGLSLAGHMVTVSHPAQLSALAVLPRLTELNVNFPVDVATLLAHQPSLDFLALALAPDTDLSPLREFRELDHLMLFPEGPVHGSEHLRELGTLTSLSLGLFDTAVSVPPLLGPAVTNLRLYRAPADTDLSGLSGHPALAHVSFVDTDMVELLRAGGPVPLRSGVLLLERCRVPGDPATLLPPGSEATVEVGRQAPA
ncbi:NACHT domain-containing NTPase [Streptomyces sp. UH6]|uniref:NACHT domain-containing protein n=1 Tax=Streptomyces sp. UH6 TaxID=2748379 RepID=UPI0015D4A8F1|nr:NACHT domain-containing protein [Streptomyces sp. UH6]NYV74509.1 NACHT domain-containing protein [Streptomyces sp. UH6]